MNEVWKPIPSLPGYEASNEGRIRRGSRVIAGSLDRYGYRYVNVAGGRRKTHRLVCEAFHGPCPEGRQGGHLDGDSQNNCADNLAWVTPSENTQHQIGHGTFKSPTMAGEAHPMCKLTDQQVAEFRTRRSAGESGRSLAREYGISPSTASRITTGKRRKVPIIGEQP